MPGIDDIIERLRLATPAALKAVDGILAGTHYAVERPVIRYCDHCGCKLATYLGDLEWHAGDCPNIPF